MSAFMLVIVTFALIVVSWTYITITWYPFELDKKSKFLIPYSDFLGMAPPLSRAFQVRFRPLYVVSGAVIPFFKCSRYGYAPFRVFQVRFRPLSAVQARVMSLSSVPVTATPLFLVFRVWLRPFFSDLYCPPTSFSGPPAVSKIILNATLRYPPK